VDFMKVNSESLVVYSCISVWKRPEILSASPLPSLNLPLYITLVPWQCRLIDCPASHSNRGAKGPDWPSRSVGTLKPFPSRPLFLSQALKHHHGMHPSVRLLQHACRITLFTRANCSLCTNAKQTLSAVWDARPFDYKEIDVMKPEGKSWRDLYEFDTPVASSLFFHARRT
jgi:hypothetical protein